MKMDEVGGVSPGEEVTTIGGETDTEMTILMIIGTEVLTDLVTETSTTGKISLIWGTKKSLDDMMKAEGFRMIGEMIKNIIVEVSVPVKSGITGV